MKKNGIYVHFGTLDDPDFLTEYDPKEFLRDNLNFIKKNDLTQYISGIHIDIEAHQVAGWNWNAVDWTRNNQIFEKYLALTKNCRTILKESGLDDKFLFSGALSFKYPELYKQGKLIHGSAKDQINSERLDCAVLMIYEGNNGKNAQDVIKKMNDYVKDVPTVAGMAINQYNYNDKSLDESIKVVEQQAKVQPNFYGVSVYSNLDYPDWGKY